MSSQRNWHMSWLKTQNVSFKPWLLHKNPLKRTEWTYNNNYHLLRRTGVVFKLQTLVASADSGKLSRAFVDLTNEDWRAQHALLRSLKDYFLEERMNWSILAQNNFEVQFQIVSEIGLECPEIISALVSYPKLI